MRRFYNTLLGQQALTGKAWFFDGVNDYILITGPTGISFGNGTTDSPFSISADVITTNSGLYQRIFNKPSEYSLFFLNNRIYFDLISTGGQIFRSYSAVIMAAYQDQKINVTGTYIGDGVTAPNIYLNGSLLATTPQSIGTYVAMDNKGTNASISLNSTRFAGKIKNVYIYDKELSLAEVGDVASGDVSGVTANIVSGWDDAGSSTDASGGVLDNYGSNNGTFDGGMTAAVNVVDW